MKKKKLGKNKKIIISLLVIAIILLLFVSVGVNRKTSFIESIIKDTTMFVEKVILFPIREDSKDQTKSYIIQKNKNESLEKEIQELKEALDLNKTLTEYTPINSTILSRNKSYWFNTLTIDKGKKAGIKENMAVVTKNGLIGKISKVYHGSSEVKLITSDDINFKVSVAINTNGVDSYAVLNGYENGLIKATGIDKTTNINVGDSVVTSGLGEMFPTGIYIGKIEKIESDKYNLSKTIYIKLKQDFNDIHYVTVLKVK